MTARTIVRTSRGGAERCRPGWILRVLLLVAAVAGWGGCQSLDQPASASFASVVIRGHSEEDIAGAVEEVLAAEGYSGGAGGGGSMVFEKEASRGRTLSRAGIVGTHEGARAIDRLRVEIVPAGDGALRVQCQASVVTTTGDPFFDNEVNLTHLRSGPYRALMQKVERALAAE